jgi:MscS family membrane protein
MNDFWNQIVLGNPVKKYILVAAAILAGLALKRILSKLFAGLLYRLVRRLAPDADKAAFVKLVIPPLESFLVIFVAIVSLEKLHFPDQLNFDIYEITIKDIIHSVAKILFIVAFFWLVLRNIDFIAMIIDWNANKKRAVKDSQHIIFFRDFLKALVGIIGLLMVLGVGFGFQVDKLLAGLGIVGAALALAAKESIENLIASFIIFFDKPFTAGDLLKVNNITGNVEKIGLRSTRIRTDQKTYVTVPNKQMVDSIVDNQTLRTQRKAELRLQIDLSTSVSQIEALLEGISKILIRDQIANPTVFLGDISGSAVQINVDYFTAPISLGVFNQLKQDVSVEVLGLMEKLNIQISGASTDIRLSKAPPATATDLH